MPAKSDAHRKYYEKQWNIDDFVAPEDQAGRGHVHDEQHYWVNPEELNLYIDEPSNRMGLMCQTVAEIAGAKLNVHVTTDRVAPTLFQKFPYLATENATIDDGEAIAQHIARFNPQAGLNGNTQFQKAMVNEWIAWCQTEWLPVLHGPLLPVLGHGRNFDQKAFQAALGKAKSVAKELDSHLKHNNVDWIVYDKISLADIYIGTCMTACFQTIFDAGFRTGMPHLAKWFELFSKHPAVAESFGHIKMV